MSGLSFSSAASQVVAGCVMDKCQRRHATVITAISQGLAYSATCFLGLLACETLFIHVVGIVPGLYMDMCVWMSALVCVSVRSHLAFQTHSCKVYGSACIRRWVGTALEWGGGRAGKRVISGAFLLDSTVSFTFLTELKLLYIFFVLLCPSSYPYKYATFSANACTVQRTAHKTEGLEPIPSALGWGGVLPGQSPVNHRANTCWPKCQGQCVLVPQKCKCLNLAGEVFSFCLGTCVVLCE